MWTLNERTLKREEVLGNNEIILEGELEKASKRNVWRERGEKDLISLATLVIVILISVTLVCLLTVLAYKAWQVKHTNTYCVN